MRKNELQTNELIYDIVGKSFNKLTVISLAHTKNGSSFWNVKCECGTEKVVNGKSLVRHSIVSCGCWNKQKEWKGCGNLSKTYWSSLVTSANKEIYHLIYQLNMHGNYLINKMVSVLYLDMILF